MCKSNFQSDHLALCEKQTFHYLQLTPHETPDSITKGKDIKLHSAKGIYFTMKAGLKLHCERFIERIA